MCNCVLGKHGSCDYCGMFVVLKLTGWICTALACADDDVLLMLTKVLNAALCSGEDRVHV
jgi:hypothetical protein